MQPLSILQNLQKGENLKEATLQIRVVAKCDIAGMYWEPSPTLFQLSKWFCSLGIVVWGTTNLQDNQFLKEKSFN